jgi:multiple sugar transport system substrate-binding protein
MQRLIKSAGARLARPLIALALAAVALAGAGCTNTGSDPKELTPVTLDVWRVFDGSDSFSAIMTAYRAANPQVSINYRKLSYDEYRREIIAALAEGRGPDIMSIHNTWMKEWQPLLAPAPATVRVPVAVERGTLRTEIVYETQDKPGPTLAALRDSYVDAVFQDVVLTAPQSDPRLPPAARIYGLPMALDTMALFYNRDLLSNAGIAQPARDWQSFQEHVKKLTRLDETGAIIQSGAALGTADNVERPSDILSLLMLQNGAAMTDQNGQAVFDKIPSELAGRTLPPSVEALVFYTDFANPEKEVYSWNDKMPPALDAFAAGQTAYFFGYSYHIAQIRNLSKDRLNFGIAPFPQITGNEPVSYANYWIEAVSKDSPDQDQAWDFLMFATDPERVQPYLDMTRKPTAHRALLSKQLEDLDLSSFAAQAPSAENWYHGTDAQATEEAFREMIRKTLSREADPTKLVELAATKVNQTIK